VSTSNQTTLSETTLSQPQLTFERYKILGFPSFLQKEHDTADGRINTFVKPVLFEVERLDPSTVDSVPGDAWFVGQLPPEVNLPDIKGVSGGPIFGYRQLASEQWTYHLVALQSWWRIKPRIVFGCSLPYFAELVHRYSTQNGEEEQPSR
jgi:hypothetical protein